jgi:hypothetical protein
MRATNCATARTYILLLRLCTIATKSFFARNFTFASFILAKAAASVPQQSLAVGSSTALQPVKNKIDNLLINFTLRSKV